MPNETEQFLKDAEVSIVDQPINPETTPVLEPKKPLVEEDSNLSNRRERRMAEKLQAERENNIALNARLQALADARQSRDEDGARDYLKSVERIYGTASPEAQEATSLLKDALKGLEEQATTRALEKFREEQQQSRDLARKEEQRLDSFIEDIEDEFNVSLTEEQQKGFFKMMERASPKDVDGNIIEYADPVFVWERYQEKLQKNTDTRAKDLSARSMTPGGTTDTTQTTTDAEFKFLRDNGII